MFRHTMQTCALLLGLVMLAGAREGRPFPPDEPVSTECCEFLREYMRDFLHLQVGRLTDELLEEMQRQEQRSAAALRDALQLQEEKAQEALRMHERTATALRDALQLQEAKIATALQGVVRQVEQVLQDRDEAALRRTLDERLQRMEEGARALGKPSTPSPEREDAAAAGGLASLQQLESRLMGLEATCSRVFPLSTPQAPPATPSAFATPPSTSSSSSTPPSTFTHPSSTHSPSPSSSPSTSPSSSAPASTSYFPSSFTSERPPPTSAPSTDDQQTERKRVQERIEEAKARRERAEAQPSPLGEALWKAAASGSLEEVQRLLDEGADVNYTSSGGWTPLMEAAATHSASSPEVASLLLSRGADVSAVDVNGMSALHIAASYGNDPVVRLLLGAGAEVDARSASGSTPLHWAAYYNKEASVRALLAGGARKDLKGWDGDWKDKTPFELARSDVIRNILRP